MQVIPEEQIDLPWEERDPKYFKNLQCDIEAAQKLRSCKSKEDVEAWNERFQSGREADKKIYLQGIDLSRATLDHVILAHAHLEFSKLLHANLNFSNLDDAHLEYAHLGFVNLNEANLKSSHLAYANFSFANLEKTNLDLSDLNHANLCSANMEHAVLRSSHLEYAQMIAANLNHADLWSAHLEHAKLKGAQLEYANLDFTRLDHVDLWNSSLQHAGLKSAHLEYARFTGAHLEDTSFCSAYVNETTEFMGCFINKYTDFRDVSLDTIRLNSVTKALLRYNMRRMAWEDWYVGDKPSWDSRFFRYCVKSFWGTSDYGRSANQLVATFLECSLGFALLYCLWALIEYPMGVEVPGIIENLIIESPYSLEGFFLLLWRSIYFSIVTMTTLGYGDMSAESGSILAHVVLCIHVLIGYVLLGSLISVLGTYITSEAGPVYFEDEKNEGWPILEWSRKMLKRLRKKKSKQ